MRKQVEIFKLYEVKNSVKRVVWVYMTLRDANKDMEKQIKWNKKRKIIDVGYIVEKDVIT